MSTKILYIEDDPSSIDLISRRLKRQNIEVTIAMNGYDGVQRAIIEKPDVILLDFNLPDINGAEVMNQLAGSSNYTHVPVIMITADCSATSRKRADNMACDGYLCKPVTKVELVNMLNQVLKQ